jgi:UDP-N-acetylglucosamine 2-epimerase (non-hydrolysing)
MQMKVLHVVGARPNFPKLAPVYRAAAARGLTQVIVHTGQHYDDALSTAFFRELGIPAPDIDLTVSSGSHAVQTATVMQRLEPVLLAESPDWLVVYGDVNSTLAAALVAAKLGVRIAHVESGLRSHDRSMPEEINRLVTDRLADLLLTTSEDASATLRSEGVPDHQIVWVGNVMIDTLLAAVPAARASGYATAHGADGSHVVVTLHRPANVDHDDRLRATLAALRRVAEERMVYFAVHPRTATRMAALQLDTGRIVMTPPLAYLAMLDLVQTAHAVVTDSGGLQEETSALGVPCLTLRATTEWTSTLSEGTNQLVRDLDALPALVSACRRRDPEPRIRGWDGQAGVRIVDALLARSA